MTLDPWRNAEVINANAYGIVGDGTDETVKIQTLLDRIGAGNQKRRRVIFPEPQNGTHYKVAGTLIPTVGFLSIEGVGRSKSILKQYTANTPILMWNEDGFVSGVTRPDIRVRNLGFVHNAAADGTTTNQYGIQFRSNSDGTRASSYGYFLAAFEDVYFNYCYVGIGAYASGTGSCPIWSTHFRDLWFHNTKHHAIKLTNQPGTGSAGQPANIFTNINVLNYDTAVLSDDAAIKLISCNGVTINGLNVEDWQNQILYATGGSFLVLNGLRTERHDLTASATDVLNLGNGQFTLNGVDFQNLRVAHASGVVQLIRARSNASVTINGAIAARDATNSATSSTVALLWGDVGTQFYADGVSVSGTGMNAYLPSSYGTGQYALVRVNGLPPAWDVAPTASATYRGRRYRTEGGTGVGDGEFVCRKDAVNGYTWQVASPQRVSIKDYGATGDGTTDDTNAISAAITAAGAGGHVTIPKGTYIVSSASTFAPVFALTGAGLTIQGEPGATVKLAATSAVGTYVFGIQADDITIRGLGINGNSIASAVGVHPRVTSSARTAILGCTFKNFDGGSAAACIMLTNNPTDTRIIGNAFYDFNWGVLTHVSSTATGILIANNTFDGNNTVGDGIQINSPSGGVSKIVIAGNLVKNIATSAISNGLGIGLAHATEASIVGNVVRNCGLDGIHVEDASENVSITGNIVTTCGRSGIAVNSSDVQAVRYTKGITVVSNTVSSCNTVSGSGGIAVEGTLAHYQVIVALNRVSGCGRAAATCYGIDIQFGANGDRVIGNTVANTNGATTAGIHVAASNHVLVQGNRCYDDQGTQTQDYGIAVDGNQTDLHLLDNNVIGNGTGGIDLSGIGTATRLVRRNNAGHITEANGTATVASGATSIAVTHGLAATPALKDIRVTPTNNLGNAAKFWTSSPTSTQFTISTDVDPGATTATFAWETVIR